jgi:hypothetical protein
MHFSAQVARLMTGIPAIDRRRDTLTAVLRLLSAVEFLWDQVFITRLMTLCRMEASLASQRRVSFYKRRGENKKQAE